MAKRPILMSGSMVAATMREIAQRGSGKSETRRCVTPSTTTMDGGPWCNFVAPSAFNLEDARADDSYPDSSILKMPWDNLGQDVVARLRPRIEVGDQLYVREAWRTQAKYDHVPPRNLLRDGDTVLVSYEADYTQEPNDGCRGKYRQAMHMPRALSLITLEVTDVQFERVQEITEDGAQREGVAKCPMFSTPEAPEYSIHGETNIYPWRVGVFTELWDSLNKARGFGWDANPWVVVISFKPVLCNIDRMAA